MHPTIAYFAPNNHIHAPNRSIDLHPESAYMHPKVSMYFAPNNYILCTQPPHRHAPKIRIHAPKSFRIHAFNSAYILK